MAYHRKAPGTLLYDSWFMVFEVMDDADVGKFVKAIGNHIKGRPVELPAHLVNTAEEMFAQIDIDRKAYDDKCEKMRANGKQNKPNGEQMSDNCQPNGEQLQGNSKSNSKSNSNSLSNDKERDKGKSERFTPPTLEECRAYWKERGFYSDPDEFFYFYDGKGWKVGKDKMQKWHSSAALWEKRKLEEHPEIKTKKNLDDYDFSYLEEEGII